MNRWLKFTGWLARIMVGATFIFSGFVKGIDPWGTIYKFREYAAALGLEDLAGDSIKGFAFLLIAVEFLIGVAIISGSFRRVAVWGATAFMAVMLPLTAWIALTDPVSDCGCFGDALVIGNWYTFLKNILLTAACLWMLKYNAMLHWLITPALQWIGVVASGIYIAAITMAGYVVQPLIDFRPFPEGGVLMQNDENGTDDYQDVTFVYEKHGEMKEFSISDDLPDENSGWVFVKRISNRGANTRGAFAIYSGDEDVAREVVGNTGKLLIIFMPELTDGSVLSSWSINSLYAMARRNDVKMVGVIAADAEGVDAWRDISMAEYPIYTADDTLIKTIVRGNPAAIYVENDTIVWKSTLSALDNDDFHPDQAVDVAHLNRDTSSWLRVLTEVYCGVLAALILFSFLPKMLKSTKGKKRKVSTQSQ